MDKAVAHGSLLHVGPGPEEFRWATGIEDTFVPQQEPGRRKLDLYELQQHYERWREDLDLAAELGVSMMRYGIPWYKVNPAPGRFEWSWVDQVMDYLVRDKGIEPIIDLVHYGCPLWLEDEFLSADYPEYVAEYARAFAGRYRSLGVHYYTPLNEPAIAAAFCGYIGRWPPRRSGDPGFVAVLNQICKGIVLTVDGLREVDARGVMVHVEATGAEVLREEAMRERAEQERLRYYAMFELTQGRVEKGHPLYGYLAEHGVTETDLAWYRERRPGIDVVGLNYYPELSVRERYVEQGEERTRPLWGGAEYLLGFIRESWKRYGRPIFLTETSTNARVGNREGWLLESVAAVRQARSEGIPVIGYTWWPLYDLVNWDYREGTGAAADYLEPMGLWALEPGPAGELRRVPTPAADLYRRIISTSPVGTLQAVRARA